MLILIIFILLYFLISAYSGRRLTPQGQRDLDRIAGQVSYFNTLFLKKNCYSIESFLSVFHSLLL